jgi:hypothetical protein
MFEIRLNVHLSVFNFALKNSVLISESCASFFSGPEFDVMDRCGSAGIARRNIPKQANNKQAREEVQTNKRRSNPWLPLD